MKLPGNLLSRWRRTRGHPVMVAAVAGWALALGTGCESTGDGTTAVTGSYYYGVGFSDVWHHGGYYYPPAVIVTPPPIYHPPVRPPPVARPTPRPSIPARPMPRGR